MKSEDGTGGRRPLLGDVDCHPPISFISIGGVVFIAAHLLISDDSLSEYREYTIEQIAGIFGYPPELMQLRVK